jgi:hypothetical protein
MQARVPHVLILEPRHTSRSTEVQRVASEIAACLNRNLPAVRKKTRRRITEFTKHLVANLLRAERAGINVGLYLNKAFYARQRAAGSPTWYTYRVARLVSEAGEKAELWTVLKGNWKQKRVTELLLTPQARDLLGTIPDTTVLSQEEPGDVAILLRDEEKEEIPFRHTAATREMAQQVKAYVQMMARHSVTLHLAWPRVLALSEEEFRSMSYAISSFRPTIIGALCSLLNPTPTLVSPVPYTTLFLTPNITLMTHSEDAPQRPEWATVGHPSSISRAIPPDTALWKSLQELRESGVLTHPAADTLTFRIDTRARRIFNRGEFGLGGRYTAEYQSILRDLRPYLQIDGSPVVEVDLSAMQLHQTYHLAGKEAPSHGYDLFSDRPETRKAIKYAFITCLNCMGRRLAMGRLQHDLSTDPEYAPLAEMGMTGETLADLIVTSYHEIAKKLFREYGLELQNKESQVAEAVIGHFVKQDVPLLVIHDSFCIAEPYADELAEAMLREYRAQTGHDIPLKRVSPAAITPRALPEATQHEREE